MNRTRKTLFAGGAAAAALALTLSFAAADRADVAPAEVPAAATAVPVASEAAPAEAPAAEAQAPALTVVPNHEVCMVNDRFFARKQIPVEVEGKTYYGCCAACKDRLAQDRTVRYAVDPVSGDEVDKATAVIAAAADDTVLYFASEESFRKYLTERR
jgi:YHS domain-containing protein